MQETILYQETNPYGSFVAYLEDDGRTIYLYLQSIHNPEKEMKALWIQNRIPAPESRKETGHKNGLAPYLCKGEIYENSPIEPMDTSQIHFIWTEEGDGVALFYKEELQAFLPPWAGLKSISGYSRYAKLDTPTASPLGDPDNGVLADRIESSRKFWEFRGQKNSWKEIQAHRMRYLEFSLGPHSKYWSADGGKFPHLAILKFQPEFAQDIVIYTTIGMSAQNMPTVELYIKDYLNSSRIELVFAVRTLEGQDSTESWIPNAIGEIIKYPWNMGKWFGEGHTISLPRRDPEALYLNFTHLFLTCKMDSYNYLGKKLENPLRNPLMTENGLKINFLYMIPITDEEVHYIRSQGATSFLELMKIKEVGWVHNPERESMF